MDELNIKKDNIKKGLNKAFNFLKQKRIINLIIIILLLFLLIGGTWIRLQNLPLLKDSTTGKYIPLALDPFYFLRIAETIIEQGGLPEVDSMRYPSLNTGFANEILPQIVASLYKIANTFNSDVTIQFIDVISPVIFFALGLLAFFFLILVLTKSKTIALISSAFLTVLPTYLYRTLAGFSDHEAIGMFSFFLVMLTYALALKFLGKNDKKSYLKIIGLGLLVALTSTFTIASWGGVAKFIFVIVPLSFFLIWSIKSQNLENEKIRKLLNYLIFYCIWFVFTILFTKIYGYSFSSTINTIAVGSSSILTGGVLLFLVIDYILILKSKIIPRKLEKYRILLSSLITMIIGFVFLAFFMDGIFSFLSGIINRFLHPFGAERIGLTVAENAQPYLMDWINQIGKIFFWLFYIGMVFVGVNISKGIGKKKNKFLFSFFWTIMVSGVLFSRISSSSLLNGTNFMSKFVYFGSLILFASYFIWLFFNDRIKIKNELILIASWLFFMLIAGRGAVRIFFVITPFVCFMVGYFIVKLFEYTKKSKDELLRMILFIVLILSIIGLIFSFYNFTNSTIQQAKYTGPSANIQWQKSMDWVRNNTEQGGIFVHWWDYGYWVQYLGERPTVTDGGHSNGFWDHLIGRYVLTTPEPETALSFMKAHNVSYLLIDPSDIGKYPAYSKIGGDEIGDDRISMIPTMQSDPTQTKETSSGMIIIYNGGFGVDEDIIYKLDNQSIFLPKNKAAIIGIILEVTKTEETISLKQPEAAFFYNNKQTNIPLRYVYYNGQFMDFEGGLEATIKIIPRIYRSNQGLQIDDLGAVMYLSPKVSKSLLSQLYLLDDALKNYETLELVHAEPDPSIDYLRAQGANLGDFVYFNGVRGPIKIWKVDYPSNIIAREEFLRESGEYAEFDNLIFVK